MGKETILDIKALDSENRILDIEIQVEPNKNYASRSLMYWAQAYGSQLNKGDGYEEIRPVICLNILDFIMIDHIKQPHTCFLLFEKDKKDYNLTEDLILHFIELPKIKGIGTRLEQWATMLQKAGSSEADVKTILNRDPIFRKVQEEFKRCTEDEELRELAIAREKYQRDVATRLHYAKAEWKSEGILEGKLEDARIMKAKGLDTALITEITGLTTEKISEL